MKELTIEEKAKAYDEALEKAKIWQEHLYDVNDKDYADELNYIFPELKESEDDRIRKALIEMVHDTTGDALWVDYNVHKEECIAWLEKKGKHDMGISEATKQKLEDNLNKALKKETPESWNEFLEKQGEQKPNYNNKELKDVVIAELSKYNRYDLNALWALDSTGLQYPLYFANLGAKWQGEQKPADKVEQKGMNIVEEDMTPFQKKVFCIIDTTIEEEHGLKQVCDELLGLAHDEIIQKPAWSEEAEEHVNSLLKRLEGLCRNEFATTRFAISEDEDWLKSLKDRVQSKQEWSEEDCNQIETIACHLDNIGNGAMAESLLNIMDKYKSLRLQNTWKPSDEQMENLSRAFNGGTYRASLLMELYQDLKKLKE